MDLIKGCILFFSLPVREAGLLHKIKSTPTGLKNVRCLARVSALVATLVFRNVLAML